MNLKELINKYFKGDGIIWGVVILLSLLSLLAVYSSTGTLAYKSQNPGTTYYVLKHFSLLVLSLIIIFIVHNSHYKYYSRLSQLFIFVAFILLLLTLAMGTSYNEARRWLTLPGTRLTVQTSDFAKLALMMYIARILSLKQHKINETKEVLGNLFVPTIIICGLILPANLSTSLIIFATALILMFVGRIKLKYIGGFFIVSLFFIAILVSGMILTGKKGRIATWENRIESFFEGENENNYQVEQAKIAIATGGFFGKGPGNSTQRDFIPYAYSDFIYAIVVEEYGFLGGLMILFLYLFLLYRAGVIVKKSNRTFGAFLAFGLSLLLVFQAFINMGVAVHLFPVTGQTLPFVSMGGSSLLFTSIAIGIILSVSRSVDEPQITKKVLTDNE